MLCRKWREWELIVHRYWNGPNMPPEFSRVNRARFEELGIEVVEWADEDFPEKVRWLIGFAGKLCSPGVRCADLRHKGNMARAWILGSEGGVYVDHDIWPTDRFGELEGCRFMAGLRGKPEGGVMGGPAGDPFFSALFRGQLTLPHRTAVDGSGWLDGITAQYGVPIRDDVFVDLCIHGWATSSQRRRGVSTPVV